jgi:hypothetical protein
VSAHELPQTPGRHGRCGRVGETLAREARGVAGGLFVTARGLVLVEESP